MSGCTAKQTSALRNNLIIRRSDSLFHRAANKIYITICFYFPSKNHTTGCTDTAIDRLNISRNTSSHKSNFTI